MVNYRKSSLLIIAFLLGIFWFCSSTAQPNLPSQTLFGAYYYDGWAGVNANSGMREMNAPSALTPKLKYEFPEREPIWGWRDDDLAIMEQQIDIAAANGIDFFVFCWYWKDNRSSINKQKIIDASSHTSLELFMKAKNKSKMKFALLVANHEGAEILGCDNWIDMIEFCSERYFSDPQYLKIDDCPYVSFFLAKEAAPYVKDMNEAAIRQGFPGLTTASCNYRGPEFTINTWYNNTFETGKEKEARPYSELCARTETSWNKQSSEYNIVPTCLVGWDKRPWFTNENFIYYDNKTPKQFRKHLYSAVDFLYKRNEKYRMVLVYAWNELGEGGYLVPTKGDPNGEYLKQIKKAKRYADRRKKR